MRSCPVINRAAAYLILQGPVTAQERWEENAGYSPSTLAAVIAGLVCAADFAEAEEDKDFLLTYADWLAAHLEEWTVTTCGDLVDGFPATTSASIRPTPTPGPARRSEYHDDRGRQRRRGCIRRAMSSAEIFCNWSASAFARP
jgi:GH15 family glucan-1,4-alpha-glucosidase